MITIICGEDVVSARNYFASLREEHQKKGSEVFSISPTDISQITKWMGDSYGLFGNIRVFFTEKLNGLISKRGESPLTKVIQQIAKDKDIMLVDFEDEKSQRDLKIASLGTVKEFKPDQNIFKLLDVCHPANIRKFCTILNFLLPTINENLILFMLIRHIRLLVADKSGVLPTTLAPWQRKKIHLQSVFWPTKKLLRFYEGLYRIDVSIKSSNNPFGIKKSLDILACNYLS